MLTRSSPNPRHPYRILTILSSSSPHPHGDSSSSHPHLILTSSSPHLVAGANGAGRGRQRQQTLRQSMRPQNEKVQL